jgi:hypothetical protein
METKTRMKRKWKRHSREPRAKGKSEFFVVNMSENQKAKTNEELLAQPAFHILMPSALSLLTRYTNPMQRAGLP